MNQPSLLSFAAARSLILETVPTVDTESTPLGDLLGRVLARDVIARVDVPPFDNSSMDGYALRIADTASASWENQVELVVGGEVVAGNVPRGSVKAGTAIRIFTGGKIPDGADAVLEQERVEVLQGRIRLKSPVTRGKNIRRRGEDIANGAVALQRGDVINAGRLGIIASLGLTGVSVFAVPRVGVLTTGDELAGTGEALSEGKIHNSNSFTLRSLVRESGCHPVDLGTATDLGGDLAEKLRNGLSCDAIVTSGGVSVGDRDIVLRTLRELGVEILFWKVNIKPGMPFAFGVYKASSLKLVIPVFALPGNPVSSMVTFLQFARPGLDRMRGRKEDQATLRLAAKLEHEYQKKDGKRHFARGIVRNENGELLVRISGSQSSGVLSSMAQSNCLVIVPEEVTLLKAGTSVEIEFMR